MISYGFTSWKQDREKDGNNVLKGFYFFFKFIYFLSLSMNTRDETFRQRERLFFPFSGQKEREGTNGNAERKPVIKRNGTKFRLKFKISKTVI